MSDSSHRLFRSGFGEDLVAVRLIDEVDIVWMTADVASNELAQRRRFCALSPHVIEGGLGERTADAPTFVAVLDLGVDEDHLSGGQAVEGEAGQLAVDARLVSAGVGVVADGDLMPLGHHGALLGVGLIALHVIGPRGQRRPRTNTLDRSAATSSGPTAVKIASPAPARASTPRTCATGASASVSISRPTRKQATPTRPAHGGRTASGPRVVCRTGAPGCGSRWPARLSRNSSARLGARTTRPSSTEMTTAHRVALSAAASRRVRPGSR